MARLSRESSVALFKNKNCSRLGHGKFSEVRFNIL
jgi:hypothetical protein